ncbi:MAG: HD domain-containing protein [Anaerolineae bacterium]|nr:HD domain-containing protein [Anaerolineae bacterium]
MSDQQSLLTPVPAPLYIEWPALLTALQPILSANPQPVYLVGGAVRDALLRHPIHDLDFVSLGDGRLPARRVADHFGGAYYPLDDAREIGRAIIEFNGSKYSIDISRARGKTLLEDLQGRDFTLNAMAVALTADMQSIIDPLGGGADIVKKIIRRCSSTSIADDPIRALRGIRQSTAFQMMIESETRKDIRQAGERLSMTSVERVRDEFMTLLNGPRPHAALRALDMLGLLQWIIPEIEAMRGLKQSAPHIFDVWEHTLSVIEALDGILHTISPLRSVESASNTADGMIVYMMDNFRQRFQDHLAMPLPNGRTVRSLLMLEALLHDCGKPATHSVGVDGRIHFYKHDLVGSDLAVERATALRLSNEETVRLGNAVRNHMRPMHIHMNSIHTTHVSRRTVYRFWLAAGHQAGIDICLLTLADYLGMVGSSLSLQDWITHIQCVTPLLDGYFNRHDEIVAPAPLLTGREIMRELDLPAGPAIGRIVRALQEAQASGEIATRDQAIELARQVIELGDEAESSDEDG